MMTNLDFVELADLQAFLIYLAISYLFHINSPGEIHAAGQGPGQSGDE